MISIKRKKKLILGLGNPEDEYLLTRHNTGYMFIDFLLEEFKDNDIKERRIKSTIIHQVRDDLVLAKPLTFMNNSGISVKEIVKWLNIDLDEDFILVHDDLDISLGKYKLQFKKSPRDHNGVKSVEQHLGTTGFKRLRIGIDNRKNKNISGEKYVLQRFSEEEIIELKKVFNEIDLLDLIK